MRDFSYANSFATDWPHPDVFQPNYLPFNFQQVLLSLNSQLLERNEENQALTQKLERIQRAKEVAERQNQFLKEELKKLTKKPKRRYRKRRNQIQRKIFRCLHEECSKRYSSQVALRAHERKKHKNTQQGPVSSNEVF